GGVEVERRTNPVSILRPPRAGDSGPWHAMAWHAGRSEYGAGLDRPVGQPDNTVACDPRPALCPDDLEEGLGALGVELRPRAALDLRHGIGHRHRPAVDPILGHRVKGVAHADDARAEGDLVGLE